MLVTRKEFVMRSRLSATATTVVINAIFTCDARAMQQINITEGCIHYSRNWLGIHESIFNYVNYNMTNRQTSWLQNETARFSL